MATATDTEEERRNWWDTSDDILKHNSKLSGKGKKERGLRNWPLESLE